jgi:hypothetical protein
MTRQRLPNRRFCETWEFTHQGVKYTASYGRDTQGRVRELFLSGGKVGSVTEAIMCDAATNISLALQSNQQPSELAHSSVRNPDGSPASPIGVVLDDMVMG